MPIPLHLGSISSTPRLALFDMMIRLRSLAVSIHHSSLLSRLTLFMATSLHHSSTSPLLLAPHPASPLSRSSPLSILLPHLSTPLAVSISFWVHSRPHAFRVCAPCGCSTRAAAAILIWWAL